MLSALLIAMVRRYLRAETALSPVRSLGNGVVGGFFGALMTDDERARVSIDVYGPAFTERQTRALADWELAWLAARMPPAASRVLVGAAGPGAEVLHLRTLGLHVDALEPATAALAGCRSAVGDGTVVAATYQELSAAVLDRAGGPAAPLAGRAYQAILLGWGSLSHVLRAEDRARLLQACVALCPRGPILASFLADTRTPRARGHATGAALGRLAARALGRPSADAVEALTPWSGFVALIAPSEIEHLAQLIGRRVTFEHHPRTSYPHVTFTCE